MNIAAVFPGQGSQYPGMSQALLDGFPYTKQVYEEASDALSEDLLKLCQEGPADTLQLTRNAQPAILVTSYAWFTVLKKELGLNPVAGAGHSLGEYTALLASGAVSLPDVVKLVRTRGDLMQSAVPKGKGKMAAVLGLDDAKVLLLCEQASKKDSIVVPANFNTPGQVVIAGHTEAVERAEQLASTPGELKAMKVIPLNVSAPFHCPLMKPVAEKFAPSLQAVSWKKMSFPIAFNVDAKLRSEGDVVTLLTEQIDHPVRWTECTKTIYAAQPCQFVEMGPGKVLTGMIKRIEKGTKCYPIDSVDELRAFEKVLQGGNS